MEYVGYALSAACLLLGLAAAGRLLWKRWGRPRSVRAEVVDKHTAAYDGFAPEKGTVSGKTQYTVTFRTETGRLYTLEASPGFFEAVSVGERGVLTRQGNRLLDFEREDGAGISPPALQRRAAPSPCASRRQTGRG